MRLIDADVLKERIENWFTMNRDYHPYSKSNSIPTTELIDIIDRMPSADAVEVIRCKDCKHRILNKHYGEKGHLQIKAYCELDTGNPFDVGRDSGNDNWFCADAERRKA